MRELDRLHDREVIAQGLHERVVRRVVEASLMLEGAVALAKDPALTHRLEDAIALLDGTVKHVRLVALDLASDD